MKFETMFDYKLNSNSMTVQITKKGKCYHLIISIHPFFISIVTTLKCNLQ